MANGWGLYRVNGQLVFDVDSCLDLKVANKAKVSTFPVELGAFASYNKVNEPNAIKTRMAVSGQERIAAFQATLKSELTQANLYNVATPTAVYLNVTLENYDHDQTAENGGLSMLVVDMALLEVREVTPAYTTVALPKPKNPASTSKAVGGKGQAQAPAKPPSHTWSTVVAEADGAAS